MGDLAITNFRFMEQAGKAKVVPADQPGRLSVEAMREQLTGRALAWIMGELGLTPHELVARLANGDRIAPKHDEEEARLLTLAHAIKAREAATARLTKAEHARRCAMARDYLKAHPTAPGTDVAMEFGISRSVVSRIVRGLWPSGRLVIHDDGRACHRGGRQYRRAGA